MITRDPILEVCLTVDVRWKEDAYCAGIGDWIFFPEKGQKNDLAKLLCTLCPVRPECLDYAVELNNTYGVFGRTTPRDRREIRMGRRDRKEFL